MAIAIANTFRDTGTDGATSVAGTHTYSAGSALGIIVGHGSSQSVSSITGVTATSQFTETHVAWGMKTSVYSAENIAGGSTTITANFSAATAYPWIMVVELTGAKTSGAYDTGNHNYQGSPSSTATDGITTTNMTPGAAGNWLLWVIQIGGGTTAVGTGFTFGTFGSDFGIAGSGYFGSWTTEYKTGSGTSAVAGTHTSSNSSDSIVSLGLLFDEAVASAVKFRKTLSMLGGKTGQRQVFG